MRGDLVERGDGALRRARSRRRARRLRASSARVRPPGPGPISITVDAVERAGGARDAAGQVEVEQEVLAERFLGGEAVPAITSRSGGRSSICAIMRAARAPAALAGEPRRQLQRRDQARGSAVPVPAMSKAVPWSGEVRTNGRPSVTLTRVVERQRLDRDQRLVVIHAERRVVGRARAPRGTCVSAGSGPRASMPSARSRAIAGRDDARSSSPSAPSSPACGLSPATASRGRAMPKRAARSRATIAAGLDDQVAWSALRHLLERHMDGDRHDRELGRPQHHHRLHRLAGRLAASLARYSVWPGIGEAGAGRARSWRPDW